MYVHRQLQALVRQRAHREPIHGLVMPAPVCRTESSIMATRDARRGSRSRAAESTTVSGHVADNSGVRILPALRAFSTVRGDHFRRSQKQDLLTDLSVCLPT